MTHACFRRGPLGVPEWILTTHPEQAGGEWTCTSLQELEVTAKATYYATRILDWLAEAVPPVP